MTNEDSPEESNSRADGTMRWLVDEPAVDAPEYKIGDFTFDSFHDYRRAQEDLRKIEAINNELDIHDPEVAVRLYHALRNGDIVFHSVIGDDFTQHIYDIVAEDSEGLLDERANIETKNRRTRHLRVAGMAVVLVAAGLFAYFGANEISDIYRTRKLAKLQEQVAAEKEAQKLALEKEKKEKEGDVESGDNAKKSKQDSKTKANPFERVELIDPSTLVVLPAYSELYDSNPQMAGWMQIVDTELNNPVVQTKEDNEYYLNHDFDRQDSAAGCLFVDYRCDIINPTTNTIVYGHNMKDGSMFGCLRGYLDEDFFNAHRELIFNTIYEERKYEIVAACLSEVAYQDEKSFRYYNFIQAENQEQFDAFVENIKALSVHSAKNIKIKNTDQLLTLSTCNSYIEDGRLFIVAKRVQ